MATFDLTAGSNNRSLGGGMVRIANRIDFKVANAKKGSALVSTDIVEMLDIPIGLYVQNVFVTVRTAALGTTLTATIGDDADPNGFDNDIDLKAAAKTVTYGADTTDAYATNGKVYTAANTIDAVVTVTAVTTWPVLDVVALCFDPSTI